MVCVCVGGGYAESRRVIKGDIFSFVFWDEIVPQSLGFLPWRSYHLERRIHTARSLLNRILFCRKIIMWADWHATRRHHCGLRWRGRIFEFRRQAELRRFCAQNGIVV